MNCDHQSKKHCAWDNADYHEDHPNEEQYRACYDSECGGLMNKGAYQGEQKNGSEVWNIHHIDSNPNNNSCKNLVATHPECNQRLG